eukprot:TRINITY_DN9525_c0_g1_i1.p2 TRINITY_DN9525_c0_g1~~TRINITY_DN9525_c0_g1_i1.p2  ORF type:complete len:54 (+),score=10.64 TRINITY_DN9525_c0_g1_i1:327-488(+)
MSNARTMQELGLENDKNVLYFDDNPATVKNGAFVRSIPSSTGEMMMEEWCRYA